MGSGLAKGSEEGLEEVEKGLGEELVDALYDEDHSEVSELLEIIDNESVNEADNNGDTPLHAACDKGNFEGVVKLMSIPDIDVNAKNDRGETAVMQAAYYNNSQLLQFMLDDPRVNMDFKHPYKLSLEEIVSCRKKKKTCLAIIKEARRRRELSQELIRRCSKKKGKISDFLKTVDSRTLNEAGKDGQTPLHTACGSNNEKAVTNLLATRGINVNVRNFNSDLTPVMEAAACCSIDVLEIMVNDPRVDIDEKAQLFQTEYMRSKEIVGNSLEELVGEFYGQGSYDHKSAVKSTCLDIIKKARRKKLSQELITKCSTENDKTNDVLKKMDIDVNSEDKEENVTATDEKEENATVSEDKEENVTASDDKEENFANVKMMYSRVCWSCSKEDVQLYKCGGCRRARYCTEECQEEDWQVHGSYCLKKQLQKKKGNKCGGAS